MVEVREPNVCPCASTSPTSGLGKRLPTVEQADRLSGWRGRDGKPAADPPPAPKLCGYEVSEL
jgi:hypothetical protein